MFVQVIEPPKTTSYSTEDGHFIKTFLISTKPNQAGWQISKETGDKMAQSFIGKPFSIVPKHLSDKRQEGHLFAESRDELLTAYKNHEHGIIQSISKFNYNDGTDDYFYMGNVKLNDSLAASALMEAGANAWEPFSVSPHIWLNSHDDMLSDWEGISLVLVGTRGAYGPDAVITKYCHGETDACTKSLAASKLCAIEDSKAASMISSLVTNSVNKDIMSTTVQQLNPETGLKQEPTQPIKQEEVKKEETVSLTKAEFEALNKQLESSKQKDEQLSQLITENKTTKLNNIFKSVKDESLKKTLTDKYFNADVNQLNDFYGDITNHVFPSLVEEAKTQAEQELKNKTIDESKGKSKAASLPKEPQVEDSKAASIVPKSVNEVLRFKKMFEVGF